jgi:phenylacetate-coenzyme A ligase PaaK-like adenylate-forming protein
MIDSIQDEIRSFHVNDWNGRCIELFHDQFQNNPLYREYVQLLGIQPSYVNLWTDIPFLPVRFFKSHVVVRNGAHDHFWFESSATTGQVPSKHFVHDKSLYEKSFRSFFEHQYGSPRDYVILALLPSYLERQHSSLVYMVNDLIQSGGQEGSGFYMYNFEDLVDQWQKNMTQGKRTLLFGVTFALMDLAERFPMQVRNTTVLETGGMKGRGREPIRQEVHTALRQAWGRDFQIHSEYGMTELLSQGYSQGDEGFVTPPWMRIVLREVDDPLAVSVDNKRGGINVVDWANFYSCPFIATDDLGEWVGDKFKVLGRLTTAETRGCNLLYVP